MAQPDLRCISLTERQSAALSQAVDFVAQHAKLGEWKLWKDAAQADTKLREVWAEGVPKK